MPINKATVNTKMDNLGTFNAMVIAMEKLADVWPEGKE